MQEEKEKMVGTSGESPEVEQAKQIGDQLAARFKRLEDPYSPDPAANPTPETIQHPIEDYLGEIHLSGGRCLQVAIDEKGDLVVSDSFQNLQIPDDILHLRRGNMTGSNEVDLSNSGYTNIIPVVMPMDKASVDWQHLTESTRVIINFDVQMPLMIQDGTKRKPFSGRPLPLQYTPEQFLQIFAENKSPFFELARHNRRDASVFMLLPVPPEFSLGDDATALAICFEDIINPDIRLTGMQGSESLITLAKFISSVIDGLNEHYNGKYTELLQMVDEQMIENKPGLLARILEKIVDHTDGKVKKLLRLMRNEVSAPKHPFKTLLRQIQAMAQFDKILELPAPIGQRISYKTRARLLGRDPSQTLTPKQVSIWLNEHKPQPLQLHNEPLPALAAGAEQPQQIEAHAIQQHGFYFESNPVLFPKLAVIDSKHLRMEKTPNVPWGHEAHKPKDLISWATQLTEAVKASGSPIPVGIEVLRKFSVYLKSGHHKDAEFELTIDNISKLQSIRQAFQFEATKILNHILDFSQDDLDLHNVYTSSFITVAGQFLVADMFKSKVNAEYSRLSDWLYRGFRIINGLHTPYQKADKEILESLLEATDELLEKYDNQIQMNHPNFALIRQMIIALKSTVKIRILTYSSKVFPNYVTDIALDKKLFTLNNFTARKNSWIIEYQQFSPTTKEYEAWLKELPALVEKSQSLQLRRSMLEKLENFRVNKMSYTSSVPLSYLMSNNRTLEQMILDTQIEIRSMDIPEHTMADTEEIKEAEYLLEMLYGYNHNNNEVVNRHSIPIEIYARFISESYHLLNGINSKTDLFNFISTDHRAQEMIKKLLEAISSVISYFGTMQRHSLLAPTSKREIILLETVTKNIKKSLESAAKVAE